MKAKSDRSKKAVEKAKAVKAKGILKDDAFWCDPMNYPFF